MRSLLTLLMLTSFGAFAQSKKDTLEIPKHIKVIVIDGEVFDIIRKVELKKSEPIQFLPRGFGWGGGGYITPAITDTLNPFIAPNTLNLDTVRMYPRQFTIQNKTK